MQVGDRVRLIGLDGTDGSVRGGQGAWAAAWSGCATADSVGEVECQGASAPGWRRGMVRVRWMDPIPRMRCTRRRALLVG